MSQIDSNEIHLNQNHQIDSSNLLISPSKSTHSINSSIEINHHPNPALIDHQPRPIFIESSIHPSQILNQFSSKSINSSKSHQSLIDHDSDSDSKTISSISSDSTSNSNSNSNSNSFKNLQNQKIQFHHTVRITGGIASKSNHNQQKLISINQNYLKISTNKLNSSHSNSNQFIPSTSSSRSFHPNLRSHSNHHKRSISSQSHHSSLINSSPTSTISNSNHLNSHQLQIPSSNRRSSFSDSFSSSVITSSHRSRSTSASSLYVPLRVPLVRAPAPFFGPTPQRVAKVRERIQVAQRDKERARGGWKAWWNNWFYYSDQKFNSNKGKAKQTCHQNHHQSNQDLNDLSDSDDGSCYHDVILEHERNKLKRKLKKIQRANLNTKSSRTKSLNQQNIKSFTQHTPQNSNHSQSWLSWIWPNSSTLPIYQSNRPSPTTSILRNKTLNNSQKNNALVSAHIQPNISIPNPTLENSDPSHSSNIRTPLISKSKTVPTYLNDDYSNQSDVLNKTSLDKAQNNNLTKNYQYSTNHQTESNFKNCFKLHLWISKFKLSCKKLYQKIKSKILNLFFIEWDQSEERYQGWENYA
ncbi:hypothetical protein O181_064241 [Austropuccinia psidii MF-1]|uniref:Uncharacterized protein n=1 Tax=Austropuccinia psidii MF-1 TaxID=1389203 RepID=A0A9Q3ETA7_9BASI|nr:hypothetical protein [Austropuccinia psidii MF-1]